MNELIFILHVISVILLSLGALRLGKAALISTIALQCVVANLFVTKQITLFGLSVTATDVFIVGAELCLNLLQEFYGKDSAKQAVRASFFILVSFLIFSRFQLWYTPNQYDTINSSFHLILNFAPRIILASITAYLVSQTSSVLIFGYLKKLFNNRFFLLRSGITTVASQFIDTVIFSFAALYGITHSITQIIFLSFTIKVITICLATPFIALAKKFLAKDRHETI